MLRHTVSGSLLTKYGTVRSSPAVVYRRPARIAARSSNPSVDTSAVKSAPSHAELISAAEQLISLKQQGADEATILQHIDRLTAMSAAAGTDKIFPEQNDGTFQAYTLTGQNAQRSSSVINLGLLSFNKYQPKDMKCRMTSSSDAGGVFKGPKAGCDQAYVLTVPFEFVEQDNEEVRPTGLKGCHLAIAEYKTVADNPQRLTIQFNKVQLEPGDNSPQHLKRWLDTLLPHNKDMDPVTGVLLCDMDQHPPEGWLDYVMMIPQYQLMKGNFGSVTLLKRLE